MEPLEDVSLMPFPTGAGGLGSEESKERFRIAVGGESDLEAGLVTVWVGLVTAV